MKNLLLFGAGKSATVLIQYLLSEAEKNNWKIIVADANRQLIEEKTNSHPYSETIAMDITDGETRGRLISQSDIVISMMPPALHILIAKDCITYKKNLLTASYADDEIKALQSQLEENGILFLCEMGLDPGIDHMSAMQIFDEIRATGGIIHSFKSHCGGLVAPESDDNPWHYKISWNPRNIVLAGKAGAVYKLNEEVIDEKYEALFDPERKVLTGNDELSTLSYYPNRNSLSYIDIYGLFGCSTFIRTTLRNEDFMSGWKNIIELKLTDEEKNYESDGKSLKDFFHDHLAKNGFTEWLNQRLTESFSDTRVLLENLMHIMETEEKAQDSGEVVPENFMLVNESGVLKNIEVDEIKNHAVDAMVKKIHEANLIMKQLIYLGLNDSETIIDKGLCSAADVLQLALEKKLALLPGDKDLIVMLHEIEYSLKDERRSIHSSLFVKGDDHIHTAMAKTVGLPLGIAAKLILSGEIKKTGLHIPVDKEIYIPVLNELKNHGIAFIETHSVI